ncbi:hypothetical protein OHT76_06690 [Streptomyces sp. NBC_00287]|uniref:IS3 family transposase n=1 Tax=Streptomyces sp. NBC_00287 TaxID=2975702 RepID=UPI002E27B237|nr:IS3 family transposase [Streptomyces sp. NBC_00287]
MREGLDTPPTLEAAVRQQLMPLIEQVHARSGGTNGTRRITRALRRKGVQWPAAPSSG